MSTVSGSPDGPSEYNGDVQRNLASLPYPRKTESVLRRCQILLPLKRHGTPCIEVAGVAGRRRTSALSSIDPSLTGQ